MEHKTVKFSDIIAAIGDRSDWLKLDCAGIFLDADCEVLYFWYDHFDPRINRKFLQYVIERHDYETFREWYDRFVDEPLTYFPSTASIFINDDLVGEVVILSKGTFDLITFNEAECG